MDNEINGRMTAAEAAALVDDGWRGMYGPPFLVTYSGSIPECHGDAWHVGDCQCVTCFGAEIDHRFNRLVTVTGQVLSHVRDESWTPVIEDLPCLHPSPSADTRPGCGTQH